MPSEIAIAWRSLWRNSRRTWLTAAGIAFALMLPFLARALQQGAFAGMVDNGTRLLSGHLQIRHPAWTDDPSIRYTITHASQLEREVAAAPGVIGVGQRGVAWALVSVGERSFGTQVMGVEPAAETALSTLPQSLVAGRYLSGRSEVVLGAGLARNLDAHLGDEVVVLGTGGDGGVAALAATLVGVFESGIADVDRGLAQVPLADFQDAFGLSDEAHAIVVRLADPNAVRAFAAAHSGGAWQWLTWQELMPEIEQSMELKRISTGIFAALLALLVTFSVFNTFMMTIYERRQEFGVLLAIGMKPRRILAMVLLESLCLGLIGIAIGSAIGVAVVSIIAAVGIPLGDVAGATLRSFHLPDRVYPAFSVRTLSDAALLLAGAVVVAAAWPALRILRLRPVDAMRAGA